MAIPFVFCTDYTGGAAGALDAVSIDDIENRHMAFVIASTGSNIYVFDTGSSEAENSPDVIRPDDATGNGRWIKQNMGVVGGSDFYYAHFEHQEAAGTGSTVSAIKNTWTQRPYNTTVQNDIDGCSLSAGDISLPSGLYDYRIIDTVRNAGQCRVKLYNETD